MSRQPARALEVINYKNVNSNDVNEIIFNYRKGQDRILLVDTVQNNNVKKKKCIYPN